MKLQEFRKLIREEIRVLITEADIQPVGPAGNKITDPVVIKNLNMAIKAVDASIRSKLIGLIEDPTAAKALKTPAQRAAMIGAMAIAFGISEQEFAQIITKIKSVLKKSGGVDDQA